MREVPVIIGYVQSPTLTSRAQICELFRSLGIDSLLHLAWLKFGLSCAHGAQLNFDDPTIFIFNLWF